MSRSRRAFVFVTVVALAVLADQGSKLWARGLPLGAPHSVIAGYWDWELAYNPGAAFSSFASFAGGAVTRVALSLVAAIALVALGVAAARSREGERIKLVALGLVAGGALGNLIDRIHDGVVTDFVRWRIHAHLWPIFNMADAVLLVGAVLLLVDAARAKRRIAPGSAAAAG